ncbi:MAG TPA: energy transducer TonB [Polyangiaceae bacterium]|nr:energy transducer TonB [Polyangiaceae bacterium]
MARRKARSTVYIVSVGAHLALGLAIAMIPKDKLREVVGIALAENKKPAPKAEPPPKREETPRARPARAAGAQRSQQTAAPTPATAEAAAPPVFTDIGIALDSSAIGGIPMQIAPRSVERVAPVEALPAKPKVLVARVSQDVCSEDLKKARLIRQVQPKYSNTASLANVRGVIRLELDIDERGVVQRVHVVRGLGYGLDESAVEAAKKIEFSPATLCGKPVSSKFTLAFRY